MKSKLFKSTRPVVGMIHVGALPGTPANHHSLARIEKLAVAEASMYRELGVNGVALENMHDVPYLKGGVGPEIVASMTILGQAIKSEFSGVTGIQVLAAANREALAVAQAARLDWVRVEGFVFAHVADEGFIDSCAAELLRYRKAIGAERIQIWADIKKKHASHAITADVSLGQTAEAAEFMRADALIVTGPATGKPPTPKEVEEARENTHLPVLLGSGMTAKNIQQFLRVANGFIVGSEFKRGGHWENPLDPNRIESFLKAIR